MSLFRSVLRGEETMPLAPGAWLNHYEVLGHLGTGGMGEVYRARDNKLQREVALKVLPKAFAQDPERVARFRREAQVLAQLNHVNIAAIYSVEQSGETHFLVMELAEGETLRDRIQRGNPRRDREGAVASPTRSSPLPTPRNDTSVSFRLRPGLPLEEALDITKQIAAGLEAAHEKPIVHRDLKPANVKVTPEGVVKILDFGLARAFAGDTGSGDPADSPTLTGMTQPGTILGTAAYMSPEQARGRKVDKRTDIWALGCVLYELLTGKWVFAPPSRLSRAESRGARQQAVVPKAGHPEERRDEGPALSPTPHSPLPTPDSDAETVADILGAVIHKEPDWSSLPASTPPNVRFVLRRCLEKDAKRRFHSATDVAIALEEPWSVSAAEVPLAAPVSAPPPRIWKRTLPFVLTGLLVAAIAGLTGWLLKPVPSQTPVHFTITLPPGDRLWENQNPLALSPDGQRLVYVANRNGAWQLFVRSLDNSEPQPLPGTEGAAAPFFSPDGQWVGFNADGKLKKISITGGAPFIISESGGVGGAAWGADDTIVFAPTNNSGLMRVSAAGGAPEVLTTLDRTQGEVSHRWPQFLPGDEAVLFTTADGSFGSSGWNISVLRLDTGERRVAVRGGHTGRYVPTGHLVYYRDGNLLAVPFDPVRLEVSSSSSATVVEGIHETGGTVGADYSVGRAGALAYVPGGVASPDSRLVWVDRNGEMEVIPAPVRRYVSASPSPDGRQLVSNIILGGDDVWIFDLARGTLSRLASGGPSGFPVWTPDGSRVAYRASRAGLRNVYWRVADGTGSEERLTVGEHLQTPTSLSSDGKWLAYHDRDPVTAVDLWVAPLEGGHEPQVFLKTNASELKGTFSPDGRWMAYQSDESGRFEVYVLPFPGPGRKFQVSTDGGEGPKWNPKGGELFFRSPDNKMMVVDATTSPAFSAGRPRMLFEGLERFSIECCEVAPDGQRFLAIQPVEPPQPPTQIHVVLNWFEELKRRVPVP